MIEPRGRRVSPRSAAVSLPDHMPELPMSARLLLATTIVLLFGLTGLAVAKHLDHSRKAAEPAMTETSA